MYFTFILMILMSCHGAPKIGEYYKNNSTGKVVRIAAIGTPSHIYENASDEDKTILEAHTSEIQLKAPNGMPTGTTDCVMYYEMEQFHKPGAIENGMMKTDTTTYTQYNVYVYAGDDFNKAFTKIEEGTTAK